MRVDIACMWRGGDAVAVLVWLNPCQTVINIVSQFQHRRLSDFIKNMKFIFQPMSKEVLHLQLLVGQSSQ